MGSSATTLTQRIRVRQTRRNERHDMRSQETASRGQKAIPVEETTGTFPYVCLYHPLMVGTVTVER